MQNTSIHASVMIVSISMNNKSSQPQRTATNKIYAQNNQKTKRTLSNTRTKSNITKMRILRTKTHVIGMTVFTMNDSRLWF